MAKKHNVIVIADEVYEWLVYEGDTPLKMGFETSRETAQIAGDSALFRLLSVGLDK